MKQWELLWESTVGFGRENPFFSSVCLLGGGQGGAETRLENTTENPE